MTYRYSLRQRSEAICFGAAALLGALLATTALGQPAAPPAAAPGAEQPLQAGAENIRGILVVPTYEDVNPAGVTGVKGVVVKGPEFLRQPDFQALLQKYLGFALTMRALEEMQVDIIKYCRARGHLLVDACYVEQDIQEGAIQIAVIEAKVGKVAVTHEGHQWFSDSIILRDVRLKAGDTVQAAKLNSDLAWANRNNYQSLGYDGFGGSFREVTANFQQHGADTNNAKLGTTDVELKVQDRFPVRPFIGADDTGIEVIGRDRLFAGVNWANAFWLDHRLNYEYVTDTGFDKFREHVASYVVPLPWRHELTVFGAYADVHPDFSTIDPSLANLRNDGTYWQVSGRYSIPLPSWHNYEQEIAAGFDFKRTDTPLLFVGTGAGLLRTNQVDVAQFSLGYGGRLRDALGRTAFSLQGVFSPGSMSTYNHQGNYTDFSPGTDPQYIYGRAELRRETMLPLQFSWYTRAAGQMADAKLIATEAWGIGGYNTVRGYDERIVSGDDGWLVVNEIRAPQLELGNLTCKENAHDWIQPLFFCDYGGAVNREPLINQRRQEVLLSVGVGFRYQMADNFRIRFDYAWQLDREYLTGPNAALLGNQPGQRAHFGLELSY